MFRVGRLTAQGLIRKWASTWVLRTQRRLEVLPAGRTSHKVNISSIIVSLLLVRRGIIRSCVSHSGLALWDNAHVSNFSHPFIVLFQRRRSFPSRRPAKRARNPHAHMLRWPEPAHRAGRAHAARYESRSGTGRRPVNFSDGAMSPRHRRAGDQNRKRLGRPFSQVRRPRLPLSRRHPLQTSRLPTSLPLAASSAGRSKRRQRERKRRGPKSRPGLLALLFCFFFVW